MTEIYRNGTDRNVKLDVPVVAVFGTMEVVVKENDVIVYTVPTVASSSGSYSFNLPFSLMQSDKTLEVTWKFNYVESGQTFEYVNATEVEVVTPILPLDEIKAIIGTTSTDREVAQIERAVRYIIQAHTGQSFGKFIGTKRVSGSGETYLRLPSRLISLTSVNENTSMNTMLTIRGGGWFLQSKSYGVPSIRADYYGYHENPYSGSTPIVAPNSSTTHNFIKHAEYAIDGVWGWSNVPAPVREAAALLINDYACGDSMYRDRFLQGITAADWRLQFNDKAFSNTGNVRANQLLEEYIVHGGWVVI